jgi:hypothetical protein
MAIIGKEFEGVSAPNTFRQKLPESEKNDKWARECIDFIGSHGKHPEALDLDKLYRAYNGYLDERDYKWLTNPYGSKNERAKKFKYPGQLKNYPIIKPVIDLLVGEKAKRFTGWQVVVTNSDTVSIYQEELNKALRSNLEQRAINVLNDLGYPTGLPSEDIATPQQLYQQFKANC